MIATGPISMQTRSEWVNESLSLGGAAGGLCYTGTAVSEIVYDSCPSTLVLVAPPAGVIGQPYGSCP